MTTLTEPLEQLRREVRRCDAVVNYDDPQVVLTMLNRLLAAARVVVVQDEINRADQRSGITVKTDLVLRPHCIVPGATVVELWYNGIFIGEVTGADGPGVRVISKYPLEATTSPPQLPNVTEVRIRPERMPPEG